MAPIRYTSLMTVIFAFLIITTSSFCVNAQLPKDVKDNLKIPDSEHIQIITTFDKSTIFGRIISIGEQEVIYQTGFGEITIPIDKIIKIEIVPVASITSSGYWFPNPNATRLFFAPTARMLNKGDGYFADYYLFFPAFAYGITDNITIGGGMSIIPGVDIDKQIFYLTPKLGLTATQKLNLSIGALIIKIPGFDDDNESPVVGLLYGVGTFGNPNASLTLGVGYGFVRDKLAEKPMLMIGGESRISQRLALVTENWILPGVDNPIVSYGMRFFGEKISVDLAFLNSLSNEAIFPGIPYVDFVFNF